MLKLRNIYMLCAIATCAPTQNENLNYHRPWSESSVPVIVIACALTAMACLTLLYSNPSLNAHALLIQRLSAINILGTGIVITLLLTMGCYFQESCDDIVYYAKTHRDEVIKKLQNCTEPEKHNPRYMQALMAIMSSGLLSLMFYTYSRNLYHVGVNIK